MAEQESRHKAKFQTIVENARELQVQIAERKRTEDALRESEQRFRTIVDSATDCIFIKDESRRYTLINPAMADVLGLPAEHILGKTDEHLFGGPHADHSRDIDVRVLKGERIEEEYTRIISGMPLTFLDTRVPMVIHNKIVGICGISRNITDRKRQQTVPLLIDQEYRSEAMQLTMKAAMLAAQSECTILLTGESGTGKDHLARFIHSRSPWAGGPFFAINCAALPSELAESELFGHEAGSFTGANRRKRGLLELAEGGTLLLDEIGELSPSVQAKLLAFLDTKTLTRVGGEKSITVNARLIVATNKNLPEEVAAGHFRADLFYRLNVFSVHVPPLRDRVEDLPILIDQVLQQIAEELQLSRLPWIAPETMEKLKRYSWPGNVRELKNVLERAAILSRGSGLDSDSLMLEEKDDERDPLMFRVAEGQPLEEAVKDLKTFLVAHALRRTGGNQTAAARLLGVSRHTVINYLKDGRLKESV
ncbi:MAG: sigma 54-interacting transcriptional regulator [Desulfomonilaceae bacterium]|nr:sigma 54-interacting transcriptional regulator [Desulfomonilaceae bacterium]